MDSKGWVVVGAAVAIVVAYFSWTMFLSPEARVERIIDGAAAAAESVDTAAFLSHFDASYSDYLHGDRATFAERIEDAFARVDRLNVTVQAMEVEVDGDTATATFELVVVAFRGDDRMVVVGTPFQPEIVIATLAHDGAAWTIARVERGISEH
jgi:hypothetical protein